MCKNLDMGKAVKATAYYRNNNLPPGKAYHFTGYAITCVCGKKTFFKPDGIDNIVEAKEVNDAHQP